MAGNGNDIPTEAVIGFEVSAFVVRKQMCRFCGRWATSRNSGLFGRFDGSNQLNNGHRRIGEKKRERRATNWRISVPPSYLILLVGSIMVQ